MKIYRLLSLAVVLTFPLLLFPAPAVSPAPLGKLESAVAFCVHIDAKNADKYKELGKAAVAGLTEEQLKELRGSSEYKESFDQTTEELKKVPADKALADCRASLQ